MGKKCFQDKCVWEIQCIYALNSHKFYCLYFLQKLVVVYFIEYFIKYFLWIDRLILCIFIKIWFRCSFLTIFNKIIYAFFSTGIVFLAQILNISKRNALHNYVIQKSRQYPHQEKLQYLNSKYTFKNKINLSEVNILFIFNSHTVKYFFLRIHLLVFHKTAKLKTKCNTYCFLKSCILFSHKLINQKPSFSNT